MRHTGGWIKIHRKIFTNWVGQDAYSLAVWVTLLGWALHKDSEIMTASGPQKLKAGQVVTSSIELSKHLSIDRGTVERRLKWLANCNMIEQQTNSRGRIITINKWDTYQVFSDDASNKQTADATAGATAGATLSGEVKNKKKVSRKKAGAAEKSGGSYIWEAYEAAFKARYSAEPVRNAKSNSVCKKIFESVGREMGEKVVSSYVKNNNNYYKQKGHALECALSDLQKLVLDCRRSEAASSTPSAEEYLTQMGGGL